MPSNFWWKKAVIYEVYVDKFAKNLRGMTENLVYLKNLGINCIWLLPHYPSPMIDGGYDVSDYLNVRKELGNLEDFRQFIFKAHEMEIKVIIDLVLNHVSIKHPWFIEASSSLVNPRRDYFLWSSTGEEFSKATSPFFHMKKSNWVFNKQTGDYYYATFYDEQADLNWNNPEVFAEIASIMDFWANLGVDGFRLDAIGHLIKKEETDCRNLPETHEIIKKLRKYLENNYPEIILLAEAAGNYDESVKYFGNGDECHLVFNFEMMAKIYLSIKRNDFSIIKDSVNKSSGIPNNCSWAVFINSHDEILFSSLEENERQELILWLDPEKKYLFGNSKGTCMRLATVFNGDQDKILSAFEILFKLPFVPVIYYGSEIGMENIIFENPPLDTRLYVRGEFDWEEAKNQEINPQSLLNKVKRIIKNSR